MFKLLLLYVWTYAVGLFSLAISYRTQLISDRWNENRNKNTNTQMWNQMIVILFSDYKPKQKYRPILLVPWFDFIAFCSNVFFLLFIANCFEFHIITLQSPQKKQLFNYLWKDYEIGPVKIEIIWLKIEMRISCVLKAMCVQAFSFVHVIINFRLFLLLLFFACF